MTVFASPLMNSRHLIAHESSQYRSATKCWARTSKSTILTVLCDKALDSCKTIEEATTYDWQDLVSTSRNTRQGLLASNHELVLASYEATLRRSRSAEGFEVCPAAGAQLVVGNGARESCLVPRFQLEIVFLGWGVRDSPLAERAYCRWAVGSRHGWEPTDLCRR